MLSALRPMPHALSLPYALCPMLSALRPMPYALCPLPYALCPLLYALCVSYPRVSVIRSLRASAFCKVT
jgi:hypothetical protein